ncbi:PPOX class F420-dependent oxidoreductase [Actinomadura viridis]|uniref:PPOX class F420-dependent oxidoreductase n=1 Tax=Actinomadura viridis TaxID=58110 RepID=UPI003679D0A8
MTGVHDPRPTEGPFTDDERGYILARGVGRLATIGPDGTPHVRPVGFRLNADGTIDIGGPRLGTTQKYRNVLADSRATFILDDVAPEGPGSPRPGRGRGIEIRGRAEALAGRRPLAPHHSDELIRIRPKRVITWNLPAGRPEPNGRDVT